MATPFATPGLPGAPNPTPSSSSSLTRAALRAPIYNPYDKFTQPEFDAWIGDITGALKRALGHEEVPATVQQAKDVGDESGAGDVSAYAEDVMEDSFAEVKARRAAKGKERATEVDEGQLELVIISSDEDSEDSEEPEYDETYDDSWGYQNGYVDDAYSDDEVDSTSDRSDIGQKSTRVSEIIEVLSDDEEVPPGPSGVNHGEEYDNEDLAEEEVELEIEEDHGEDTEAAERAHVMRGSDEDHISPEGGENEDETQEIEVIEQNEPEAEPFPPVPKVIQPTDLSDPWAGPSTYAEDFYSGGDIRPGASHEGSAHLLPAEAAQVTEGGREEIPPTDDITQADSSQLAELTDPWDGPTTYAEDFYSGGEIHTAVLQQSDPNILPGETALIAEDEEEFPPKSMTAQPVDITDPWTGPRTFAEDFYSGGEIHPESAEFLTPSHLTPAALTPQNDEDVGMVITPGVLTPEAEPSILPSEHEVSVVDVDAEDVRDEEVRSESFSRRTRHAVDVQEQDFDSSALDELYAELEKEHHVGFDEHPTSPHRIVTHERSPSPPRALLTGHVDWNWPPAFSAGRLASGAGHLETSEDQPDADIIDEEDEVGMPAHEILDISEDEQDEDIQGPMPLGTSDLDIPHEHGVEVEEEEEGKKFMEEDQYEDDELVDQLQEDDALPGGEVTASHEAPDALVEVVKDATTATAAAAEESATQGVNIYADIDDLYIAADQFPDKTDAPQEHFLLEPMLSVGNDFGDLPTIPVDVLEPLPGQAEMLNALAEYGETPDSVSDADISTEVVGDVVSGSEVKAQEKTEVETVPEAKPEKDEFVSAAEDVSIGPVEPQTEEEGPRGEEEIKPHVTIAVQEEPVVEREKEPYGTFSMPPICVQEKHELYIVTEVADANNEEDQTMFSDVMTDHGDGPAHTLEFAVDEVVTEGRRTEEPEAVPSEPRSELLSIVVEEQETRIVTEVETDEEEADEVAQSDIMTDRGDGPVHRLEFTVEEPVTEGRRTEESTIGPLEQATGPEFLTADHGNQEEATSRGVTPDAQSAIRAITSHDTGLEFVVPEAESEDERPRRRWSRYVFNKPPVGKSLINGKDSDQGQNGLDKHDTSPVPRQDTRGVHVPPKEQSTPAVVVSTPDDETLGNKDSDDILSRPNRMLDSGFPMPVSADPTVPDPTSIASTPNSPSPRISEASLPSVGGPREDETRSAAHLNATSIKDVVPPVLRKQLTGKSTSGLFTPMTDGNSTPSSPSVQLDSVAASIADDVSNSGTQVLSAASATLQVQGDDVLGTDVSRAVSNIEGTQSITEAGIQHGDALNLDEIDLAYPGFDETVPSIDTGGPEKTIESRGHHSRHAHETGEGEDADADGDIDPDYAEDHHIAPPTTLPQPATQAEPFKSIGSNNKLVPRPAEDDAMTRPQEHEASRPETTEVANQLPATASVPPSTQKTQLHGLSEPSSPVNEPPESSLLENEQADEAAVEDELRPLKRKRPSPDITPATRQTRSMSAKNIEGSQKVTSWTGGQRRTMKGKGKQRAQESDNDEDTRSITSSTNASVTSRISSRSRKPKTVSRTNSRASSIISSAPSSISVLTQISPSTQRQSSSAEQNFLPLIDAHTLLHHHHHNRPPPQYAPVSQRQQAGKTELPPAPRPQSIPTQSSSANLPSSKAPVTRSNCRYHKISVPREENGPRVFFVVPGCSLSNPELVNDSDDEDDVAVKDHGYPTFDEASRLVPNVETLDFSSYLIGTLRQLVGVDLLREREVFYLPQPGEQYGPKQKKEKLRLSTRDSMGGRGMPAPGSPQGSLRSPVKASPLKTESGPTSTDSISRASIFGNRRSLSISASVSIGELSDPEDNLPMKRLKAEQTEEPLSPASRIANSQKVRRSRRLGVDAAAYKPEQDSTDGSDNEERLSRMKRNKAPKRGMKRSRTAGDTVDDDADTSNAASKKRKLRTSSSQGTPPQSQGAR